MKKLLFIDRDGVLIQEAPPTYQIDSFSKLAFYPGMISALKQIVRQGTWELVMVSNQDGLGTEAYPEESFTSIQSFLLQTLAGEGIHFSAVHIDRSFAHEGLSTRKPGTAMLTGYMQNPDYDLRQSYVIGDRVTDMQLAANLGCAGIWLVQDEQLGASELSADQQQRINEVVALRTHTWEAIAHFLALPARQVSHIRDTRETQISVALNLDGTGKSAIQTGLGFFDHMLDQLARHGQLDLTLTTQGDLHIDEHHTIEDTALALGEAFHLALQDKRGMMRYGFCLPMDDCLAQVAIDFGGRPWLVWDASFQREKIGEMPTEMFFHFFKSFSDAAKCNLNIQASGTNEHHKIEAIFKAFAKAIRMAVAREAGNQQLPSTKGIL